MRTRNGFVQLTACCLAVSGLVAGCGTDATSAGGGLEGQSLVFVNYGGSGADAAKAAWVDPFGRETGVRMAMDAPSDPAKIKAMVESGRTTWDLVDIDTATVDAGCGTLFEKRGPDVDISHIDEKYLSSECGIPIVATPQVLVYNKEKFGDNPPTKITDFMDTKRFPGKRTTFNYAVGGLEGLLLADGVEPDDLYPLDYDRAGKAIAKLGDNLVLHSALAQQSENLISGDFAMCLCYSSRASVAEESGAKLGVVWHHMWQAWDELAAVKGSKSPEAQRAFLNFVATPEAQAAFSERVAVVPTTPSAKPKQSAAIQKFMPTGKEAQIEQEALYDAKWWADEQNRNAAFEAWTEMTAG